MVLDFRNIENGLLCCVTIWKNAINNGKLYYKVELLSSANTKLTQININQSINNSGMPHRK